MHTPYGLYELYFKRPLDFTLALVALIVLSPVFFILIIVGTIAVKGNPFFTQKRPGRIDRQKGQEKIFVLIKFRTMSNEKDENGDFLPDEKRLNSYGKFLRSTSLDELPELINILKGDMSIVGPRPQLVRDMVFMTPEQRKRHMVRQGLTGLAQVNGRNNLNWEEKFKYDLEYINKITFFGDLKIILETFRKVFERDGITEEGMATAEDLGEYLLKLGSIKREEFNKKLAEAKEILGV